MAGDGLDIRREKRAWAVWKAEASWSQSEMSVFRNVVDSVGAGETGA